MGGNASRPVSRGRSGSVRPGPSYISAYGALLDLAAPPLRGKAVRADDSTRKGFLQVGESLRAAMGKARTRFR